MPPRIDGVLISHAHPQHTAGIAHLPYDTHIYASVMTAAILKAKQDISPGPEHEYVYKLGGDRMAVRSLKRGSSAFTRFS